jgi:hypothetical protein
VHLIHVCNLLPCKYLLQLRCSVWGSRAWDNSRHPIWTGSLFVVVLFIWLHVAPLTSCILLQLLTVVKLQQQSATVHAHKYTSFEVKQQSSMTIFLISVKNSYSWASHQKAILHLLPEMLCLLIHWLSLPSCKAFHDRCHWSLRTADQVPQPVFPYFDLMPSDAMMFWGL